MNLDILSLNLALYVSTVFTALCFFICLSLYKSQAKKKVKRSKAKSRKSQSFLVKAKSLVRNGWAQLVIVSLSGIVLSVVILWVTDYYTDTPLPLSFILMCLPFTFLFSTLVVTLFIKKRLRILTGVTLIVALLFSLVIINDYYRYYPTLGEVFGKTDAQAYNNLNNITVNYQASTKQNIYNSDSIEGSLEHLSTTSTSGKLYAINIPGTVSNFKARTGYVYVPAIYNSPAKVDLPVIILTAGDPGTPENWVGIGLQNIMDEFAKSHDGITPLVFVVDSTGQIHNDTECVNSSRGNIETYLTVDVPNYIKANFRVDTSPHNWAIGGLSMGGMCALMLTLRHPTIFNYFIDLGGEAGPEVGSKQTTIDALFDGSEQAWAAHQPLLLMQGHSYDDIGGFYGDGSQDYLAVTSAISQLSTASKKAGIDSVTEFINGAHTFNVWAELYQDSLPWISNRIGATSCVGACT